MSYLCNSSNFETLNSILGIIATSVETHCPHKAIHGHIAHIGNFFKILFYIGKSDMHRGGETEKFFYPMIHSTSGHNGQI